VIYKIAKALAGPTPPPRWKQPSALKTRRETSQSSPIAPTYAGASTWTISADSVESPQAVGLLRDYFAELRYFHRKTTEQEIDETSMSSRHAPRAAFVLRASGAPAGCLGLYPTGELTRIYFAPKFRR
jgi:hypothetical protein